MPSPAPPRARAIRAEDFAVARAVADDWMGRPVGLVMHRLFFEELGPSGVWLEREDRPVGFLLGLASEADPDLAYVHFHAVDPAERRRGLGSLLYREFGARMHARGRTRVRALAPLWNTASQTFHERLGFVGTPSPGHVGPGQDRIVYERALPFPDPPPGSVSSGRTESGGRGRVMADEPIHEKIEALVTEEHDLLHRGEQDHGLTPAEHARLENIRVALDRAYDQLRQRRARREFGMDPEAAESRTAETVEHYVDSPDPKLPEAD